MPQHTPLLQDVLLADFLKVGALPGGISMQQQARKAEADLRRVEKESFNSYVSERSNNKELMEHVSDCDSACLTPPPPPHSSPLPPPLAPPPSHSTPPPLSPHACLSGPPL